MLLSLRPLRLDHVAETALGDEVVLYDADRCQAFTLNPAATAVWARCDGIRSVADLVAELHEASGAPADQIERDVVALLERLRDQRLITVEAEPA